MMNDQMHPQTHNYLGIPAALHIPLQSGPGFASAGNEQCGCGGEICLHVGELISQ